MGLGGALARGNQKKKKIDLDFFFFDWDVIVFPSYKNFVLEILRALWNKKPLYLNACI